MGTGMTTDRLFCGLDIPKYHNDGKLDLVENSFMNHEYVVFEKLMDSPDFILEQLKEFYLQECLEIILEYILLKLDSL
jgi:hypothetical protein